MARVMQPDPRRRPAGTTAVKALRKYLAVHAEPESGQIRACLDPGRRYGHVLCIPAYGEGDGLLRTLSSIPEGPRGEVLVIVVVNESPSSPDWAREGNQRTLAALRGRTRGAERSSPFERHRHPRGDLLVINRTETGLVLPEGQGVGLARKIGADVALAVWATGGIESPWLHCSDADVLFPADYFRRPLEAQSGDSGDAGPAAFTYEFRHLTEPGAAMARAALRYESFLRYYVLGLRSAGSRYAFHTVGSTLALSPLAYAGARGFPRRNAAEDFHLLAKLAKLGPIRTLRGEPLLLSGRVSARVPFGTGVGITKELERAKVGDFFPAYNPRIFAWLAVWLRALEEFGNAPTAEEVSLRDRLCEHAVAAHEVDAARLCELLDGQGAIRAAEVGQQRGARHLHERFDALRTLRFIHTLRDRQFPAIPLETAIREAPFIALGPDAAQDPASTREALARLEATDPSAH